MITKIKLFDLEPWQKSLFDLYNNYNKNKWFVVKAKRQVGKSICMEGLLIAASLKHANSFSLFVSPIMQQARKVYQDLVRIAYPIIKKSNGSQLEITFINNSIVKFGSAEQADGLRGFTVKHSGILIIDEAAFCKDDVFYQILVPTTNVFHSDIFIVSTPKFKRGFFFNLWLSGLENIDGTDKVFAVDWNNYDTSKYLPPETLEIYRQQMPRLAFQSEFLAEFIDGEGSVFASFKDKMTGYQLHPNIDTIMGVDWGTGTGSDYTVLTVGQLYNGKACIAYQIAFNDKNASDTIKYISKEVNNLKRNGITSLEVTVEKNSIGNVYGQLLNDALPDDVLLTYFNTTNKSKDRIIKQLITTFETNKIILPQDQSLSNELSMYSCTINSNGNPIYSAPDGYHDDRVMSLCFCVNRMYVDL